MRNDSRYDINNDLNRDYSSKFPEVFPKIDEWDKKKIVDIYNKFSNEDLPIRKIAKFVSFLGDPRIWSIALPITLIYGAIIWNFQLFVYIFTGGFYG